MLFNGDRIKEINFRIEYGMENLDIENSNIISLINAREKISKIRNSYLKTNNREDHMLNESMDVIRLINKRINKLTNYKFKGLVVNGEYDYTTYTYIFREGTKKKDLVNFIKLIGGRLGYESYHLASMHDCTGDITSKNIEIEKNKVIITYFYDL